MVHPATSVFNLPATLSAKADPDLTHNDELHFARIAQSIDDAIAETSERLAAARRSQGGGDPRALHRDLEIHRLTARSRMLSRYGVDLCLGRIVPTDGSAPTYVGRLGLTDRHGQQLMVDWRSPAAEPFFAATHADPQGIASRRRYRWAHVRIIDYWDEVFTADGIEGHAALDDQSAFIASLGASRSPQMQDVLGTIQADQDAIIRASSRGALVVDGGPGTGKTVVALHRTAYLLYSDPRLGHERGGVLFVGPHDPYLAYVDDVLPSLGEEGVQICTLRDFVPDARSFPEEQDEKVAALKADARIVSAIERAAQFYEEPPGRAAEIATEWGDARLRTSELADAFSAPSASTPHNEGRDVVLGELVDLVVDKIETDAPDEVVRASVRRSEDLVAMLSSAWPLLRPEDVVADLWSVPAFLRHCAPWLDRDDVRVLQRSPAAPWTISDLPLLDAARRRIGDPASASRTRARTAALAARRAQMADVIDDLVAADDGEGLVQSLRQQDLKDVLSDDDSLHDEPVDPLAGPFAHIVVDEAQELTDAEWQMLLARCPSGSFTIVGDRAQARHGFTESWEERLRRIGLNRVQQRGLTINYRTPREVMEPAAPVIRAALPDANVPTSIRSSGIPVRYGDRTELEPLVSTWLSEHHEGTVCVIGDPSYSASSRVSSLTPVTAKGLEFDFVVLVDPDSFGGGIEGAVDRYVAMTRPTQHLAILTTT